MNAAPQLLYNSRILNVSFNLAGSESIRKDSYVQIVSYDLFRNYVPSPGGMYDAHTGTVAYEYKCQTCYNGKHTCLGHPGHMQLNYPVWSPMAVAESRKWLRLICFECGMPIIDDDQFMKFPLAKRLDLASKAARTTNKRCVHCNVIHPIVKKDRANKLLLTAETFEDKKLTDKWVIYPHTAATYFAHVTDETVIKLGKRVASHPRNFVLTDIQVPPVTIRPDIKKIGGGRSTNDDLTTILQIIAKKNKTLPPVIPPVIDQKYEKAIFELNNAYYEFVRAGGTEGGTNSVALRLKGKGGYLRKHQMGKRVHGMCRSTIIGDPRIKINEVGIPLAFARAIQVKEVAQEYNIKRLLAYVQNGRKRYPGAAKIIKRNTGVEYDVGSVHDDELQYGDTVMRDIIDGDIVNFNRQPSLTISSISAHSVKVILDPDIKTLLMNPIACAMYNADF